MIRNSFYPIVLAVTLLGVARAAEPDAALTLRQAVALALEKSPELAVYSAEMRAAEARVVQAGVRPNVSSKDCR